MVSIKFVILLLIAYMLGNISPSTILAKAKGIDIKKAGSGNAGTTNALRVLGAKAAVITLVIDIGKGFLAVFLAGMFLNPMQVSFCALAVFLGHVWPLLLTLGSVTAALAFPFLAYFMEKEFLPAGICMALILIFKHRANIARILSGNESKLSFKKKENKGE